MPKFSSRYGYAPQLSATSILEDAPTTLRIAYVNGVLDDLTYVDRDDRYDNSDNRPLGVKRLNEELSVLLRQEPQPNYYDSWQCWDIFKELLISCQWYGFYDCLEYIGKKL